MDCSSVKTRRLEILDGTLPPGDRTAVDAHVATCSSCREALSEARLLPELLGRMPRHQAPPDTFQKILDRVSTLPRTPSREAAPQRVRRLPLWAPVAAAAAVLAIIIGLRFVRPEPPRKHVVFVDVNTELDSTQRQALEALDGFGVIPPDAILDGPFVTERLQ